MKKTAKLFSTLILAITLLAVCFGLVACKGDKVDNYFVTYDGNTITVSGEKGAAVEFPDATREGYLFDGWYTSEDYSGSAVESAVFDKKTTYYAKWAEICTITLQPEGGTIKGTTVIVKQGANLLEALAEYVPEKGSLQFGGWFEGNTQITSSSVAPKGSLTLTARYKAAYTVNAYMEKLDGSGYDYTENFAQGYAFVGEGFFPELETEGFSVEDENDIIIAEDSSKNVFNVHFARNVYTVSVYESYPQGAVKLYETKKVKYGETDYLPDTDFTYEGYLMLGWTTNPGGTYTDVIGSDYVLKSDVSLYPLWEAGYSDMFSGDDYIFLMHDADNTAVILRGGIKIEGKYNKLYELYEFKNNEGKAIVRAKIDGEHFIYYDTRNASYTLLDLINGLDDSVTVSFDETNGISYYDSDEGVHLVGTYEIDEDGVYVATLHPSNDPEGEQTVIAFIVGTYRNTPAFRIRGNEYKYGTIARRAVYYPVMTFDGFGTVTLATSGQSSSFTYSSDKEGVITIAYGQQDVILKIMDYGGTFGYDFYEASLDKTYSFGQSSPITLTLDGCATAVFKGEDETFIGTYSYQESVLYDTINGNKAYRTIVTVVSDTNETRVYVLYMDYLRNADGEAIGNIPVNWFKEVGADYSESRFVDNEGKLTDSYLIIEGDGSASTHEYIDGELTKTSTGTIEKEADGYSYTYTPEKYTDTVQFKNYSTTIAFSDYQYNGMNLCFALKVSDEAGSETEYYDRYRTKGGNENGELIKASVFGIYVDADGNVFCGILSDRTTYYLLTDGSTNYYLSFDETDSTRFYVLENTPLVMYKRVDGETDRTSTMTVTWKEISDGRYEAVYSVTDSSTKTTTNIDGYYTSQYLQYPGFDGYLYTFTANDGSLTFKFYLSSSGSTYYFNYYDADAVITLGSYAQLKDDNSTDSSNKLLLTDELSNGKLVLVYAEGENTIKGTFDTYTETVDGKTTIVVGRKVNAFGDEKYSVTVYKFTSLDGNTTFEFTLNNGYFRICAENETFNGANGDKLELDGATHIAKYTDADGSATYSYYVWVDGVLEKDGRAVLVLIGEEGAYLDVLNDTFRIRGTEAGTYNIFKNGVPYGKTIELDGQGKATIKDSGSEDSVSATYKIDGDEVTVFGENGEALYLGKLGTVSIGGNSYPAYSLLMDYIAGSYINKEDLSVIVLDNAGNAVRYNSYGVSDQGYYFRIDDNLFYFINSESSFAGLYTFDRDTKEIVNTGTDMTFYSSDFSSVVFYSTGSMLINNSESMYYVIDEDGKIKTYKAASDVSESSANSYGYVVGEIEIDEENKIRFTVDGTERTYTLSDGTHVTFTDAEGRKLEFQPDGGSTFTVTGTLTSIGADGKETTAEYYVGLDYADGKPYVYLADQVSDYVNGGVQKFNFTRNYEIEIDYDAKTFSFPQNEFTTGMYAYNYMYLLYLNYYGTSYASLLSSINGLLSIVCETAGDQKTYTVSGMFNYIKNDDETAFKFTNGTLSEAGYYSSRYGHAYVAEFVVNVETYHLTFFLMPPDTADGVYAYRIYTLTKVTGSAVINEEKDTVVYSEELVYTEFNITDGGKDSEGNDTYYSVGESFIPSLKYEGKLIGSYPASATDDNSWTLYGVTFEGDKLVDEIRYLFTVTYDEEGKINGGTAEKQILLAVTTESGDTVYAWYDGNETVIEVLGIRYKDQESITEITDCKKNASGESFTVTIEGVTYTLDYTFTEDESGEKQVTVILTKQTQEETQSA